MKKSEIPIIPISIDLVTKINFSSEDKQIEIDDIQKHVSR